ncbi:MAG: AtpZ/AtpI family protein [Chloroflexi bacterium]|nr:AtpZ/AtpI family protein [Chloroflexota bacterium]
MGWYVAFSLILGVGLGVWADGRWHTAPLFTLVGLFLGLAIAIFGMYRMLFPSE